LPKDGFATNQPQPTATPEGSQSRMPFAKRVNKFSGISRQMAPLTLPSPIFTAMYLLLSADCRELSARQSAHSADWL
jgi:hypothetical protein